MCVYNENYLCRKGKNVECEEKSEHINFLVQSSGQTIKALMKVK